MLLTHHRRLAPLVLLTLACGAAPTIVSTTPVDGATGIARSPTISITFSEPMAPASLAGTFTVASASGPVAGTISTDGSTAVFTPAAPLTLSTQYTASITTAATSVKGVALGTARSWRFTTTDQAVTVPTVVSNSPLALATDVPLNAPIRVTFSEAMDPATLNETTFTVSSTTPVLGTVSATNSTATFLPIAHLPPMTSFTVTVTTAAKSAAGVALATDHVFRFTTGTTVTPGLPVALGSASAFVILAKSGVSNVPTSTITGDVGLSPAAGTFLTGFALSMDATNAFSTSPQVTGKLYAADFAAPTPALLTTAISDQVLAFTDAAGRAADVTELGAGSIGGRTLGAGVYRWSTGLGLPTDVTLSGSATDVWIFQVAQNLTVANGVRVTLTGGALPKNVFWQVAGAVELGTTSHLEGIVLCQTAITLRTGASLTGRAFAQTAVALDGNTVTGP